MSLNLKICSLICLMIFSYGALCQEEGQLIKFQPRGVTATRSDVRSPNAPALFGQVQQGFDSYLSDCSYVPEGTHTASFQRDNYCNGIDITFCFATIACKSSRKLGAGGFAKGEMHTIERSCPAINGKCPANPEDCLKAHGFMDLATGTAAIGSLAPSASAKPQSAGAGTHR